MLFLQYFASSLPGSDDAARRMVAPLVAQKGSQAGGGQARLAAVPRLTARGQALACHGSSAAHAIHRPACRHRELSVLFWYASHAVLVSPCSLPGFFLALWHYNVGGTPEYRGRRAGSPCQS